MSTGSSNVAYEREVHEGPGTVKTLPKGSIVGFGNPLLDVMATVPHSFYTKYDLKPHSAILAEEKHMPLYQDLVDNFEVEYVAGGATQNAIRVAQWMSRSEGATAFVGSIGNDEMGKRLTKACTDAGVRPLYYVSPNFPTGVCAVPILDKERTLCTKLEAANDYKHSHTLSDEVQKLIANAKLFYSASFVLTVPEGPTTLMHLANYAAEHNKVFAMNLSADFLIEYFFDPMKEAIRYADLVFCNEHESFSFGKKMGWSWSLEEIALKLSAMPKASGSRGRIVVFSQGPNPTIVAKDGKITIYPVPPLAEKLLRDTNGAGDAFVGGFLARFVAGDSIAECVRCGHFAARTVIQRSGCTFPDQPDI